jgi:hypothetical protein
MEITENSRFAKRHTCFGLSVGKRITERPDRLDYLDCIILFAIKIDKLEDGAAEPENRDLNRDPGAFCCLF